MQYTKILVFLFFTFFGFAAVAQVTYNQQEEKIEVIDSLGVVKVIQDARIDQLLETDKEISSKNQSFSGYRVQIFSGRSTDREKAFKVKEEFLELFPDERAYVVYHAPDFRVRVGNFRSKIESIELYKACLKYFPNCYPVKTRILFTDMLPIPEQIVEEEVVLEENAE